VGINSCADVVLLMFSLAHDAHACEQPLVALPQPKPAAADLRAALQALVQRVAALPTRPTVLLVPPLPLRNSSGSVPLGGSVPIAHSAYEILSEYIAIYLRELVERSEADDVYDWATPAHGMFEAAWRSEETCTFFQILQQSATAAAKQLGEFIRSAHRPDHVDTSAREIG
jgi:hypothetical protein